jgi:hypothetical protein
MGRRKTRKLNSVVFPFFSFPSPSFFFFFFSRVRVLSVVKSLDQWFVSKWSDES